MARSLLGSLCVCGLALAFVTADAQQAGNGSEEIVLESGPLSFNGQTNLFEMKSPRIRQGDLYITADDAVATGVEFDEASEMRFAGNVHIEVGNAVLDADSAVFTIERKRLSRGELEGKPASFSHTVSERQKPITGTASKMSYDSVLRTLRMTDAWLQRDQSEFTGCDLIYNFTTQGFSSGDADCENPFRMRVVPDSDRQDNLDPPQ